MCVLMPRRRYCCQIPRRARVRKMDGVPAVLGLKREKKDFIPIYPTTLVDIMIQSW